MCIRDSYETQKTQYPWGFKPHFPLVSSTRFPDEPFLGSKKTRQSFIHKLNIGVCTRPPSTRRHFSSIFALSSPGYPLAEAATNLIIKERLDAVLAHAFVMHQRIKLIFQQVPFIGFRITRLQASAWCQSTE